MARRTPNTPKQEAGAKGGLFGRMRNKDAAAGGEKKGVGARMTAGVDRMLGRTHGALTRVNHYLFMGGMFAGLLGKMKNVKGVGGAFGFAEKAIQKPEKLMSSTSVGQLGNILSPSQGLERAANALGTKDSGKKLASGLKRMQQPVGAVEKGVTGAVGTAVKGASGFLGDRVEGQRGRLIDPLVGRLHGGAEKHSGKAQGLLADMMSGSKGDQALSGVNGSLQAASAALKSGDDTAYVTAMEKAREQLAGAKGGVDKKLLKSLESGIKKVGSATEKVGQRKNVAEKLGALPESIRKAPDAFKNANLRDVALKGAMVTGTVLQVTGTARGLSGNVSTLKNLYFDLTGEKKISTRKLLFSKDVPDIVKEARSQIFKQYGPRVALDFANTVATGVFAVMQSNGLSLQNKNMKVMVGSLGLTTINQLYQAKSQEGFLPIYDAVSQMPKLEDAQYAVLISAASKNAAQAGGVESPLVQALAVEYAREGIRPVELLKEIESGRFNERARHIVEKNSNAMQGQTGTNREVVGSHTQQLQDKSRNGAKYSPVTEAERITADPTAQPLTKEENTRLAEMEKQFGDNPGIHTQRLRNEARNNAGREAVRQ